MKTKHNKKRNTAFIYEALVREMAKTILQKNKPAKHYIKKIIVEHFSKGTPLKEELECFEDLTENISCDQYTAEKIIWRVKQRYGEIDQTEIFNEQSKVIKKINKQVGPHVFSNFVPNYKTYATISQIFNNRTTAKQKVIMEQQILKTLTGEKNREEDQLPRVDSLVVNSYVKRFNEQYNNLLPEQKSLLTKYIVALGDNEPDFKVAFAEELRRLHASVKNSLNSKEVQSDQSMVDSTLVVLEQIKKMNVSNIDTDDLKKVLKLQVLVNEYDSDDN
jgi:hypothetical protein